MYASMSYKTAFVTERLTTHFTWIWTLTPTYITGISPFTIVYMILFIQHTLVKTQRLIIRIYSDTTIIFIAMYILNKNPSHLNYWIIYKGVLDDLQFFV